MQITINTETLKGSHLTALLGVLIGLFPAEVQEFFARHGVTVTADSNPVVVIPPTEAPAQIDPADNPAAGAASAAEVFTQGVAAPADPLVAVSGAQYTIEQLRAAQWTDEQIVAGGYATRAEPDPAAVFAGGTNAPLVPSSGQQPAPSNTGATSPQPSSDAAAVFAATSTPPAPPPANVSAAAPSTSGAPELDKDGLPWDGRIHASTRTKTAAGAWKKRKGVDDGVVASVTAELRTATATQQPAATFTPLNAQVPPPPPPAAHVAPPPPPGATNGAAPPPPPIDFVYVARYVGERAIPGATVTAICNAHGLDGLAQLTQRKDLAPAVLADLKAKVGDVA